MSHSTQKTQREIDELAELVRLLVGCDRETLQRVVEQVDNLPEFTDRVSTVLGDAMRVAVARDQGIAKAIAPLVGQGVLETVERDPGSFGRALAPAMGPAIRQSVRQMFQSVIENFERALDQSLSARSWKWRFEAWRTGKPFAEVVFSHTLAYRAEHAFLIHSDAGLLLQHASRPEVAGKDGDLVSAMLTAIQQFVRDAFEADEQDALRSFQVGEQVVWIEQGAHSVLAVVLRGHAPQRIRTEFRTILDEIEVGYASLLADFDGDVVPFEALDVDLERCLVQQQLDEEDEEDAEPKEKTKRAGLAVRLVGIALLIGLVAWWFVSWREGVRWQMFLAELRDEPGIVVAESDRQAGRWTVRGFRDRFAAHVAAVAASCDVDLEDLDCRFEPYASSHPEFVLARLKEVLSIPGTVTVQLEEDVVTVRGEAPHAWVESLQAHATWQPMCIDHHQLVDLDQKGLDAAMAAVEAASVRFSDGQPSYDPTSFQQLLGGVESLLHHASVLGQAVEFRAQAIVSSEYESSEAELDRAAGAVFEELRRAVGWVGGGYRGPARVVGPDEVAAGAAFELRFEPLLH